MPQDQAIREQLAGLRRKKGDLMRSMTFQDVNEAVETKLMVNQINSLIYNLEKQRRLMSTSHWINPYL